LSFGFGRLFPDVLFYQEFSFDFYWHGVASLSKNAKLQQLNSLLYL
jgi:hypothetical protein